jgi:hypothetical protein
MTKRSVPVVATAAQIDAARSAIGTVFKRQHYAQIYQIMVKAYSPLGVNHVKR